MSKKIGFVTVLLGALILSVSCNAPKYSDAKAVMEKMITATETLSTNMDKATDAPAVASAISTYTAALKAEQTSFMEIIKKYPELKDAKDPPKELKETSDKLNGLGEKVMSAMAKVSSFSEDPQVQAAVQKMSELQME